MEFQKELREKLKSAQENCYSQDHFIHQMTALPDELWYGCIDHQSERDSIKRSLEDALSEPWYFIATKASPASIYLHNLHNKLVKHIKNENKRSASISMA